MADSLTNKASTTLYQQPGNVEKLEDDHTGDFHPIHIGDKFQEGRYTIINMLCWGHASTV
jgi:hypothetical protein